MTTDAFNRPLKDLRLSLIDNCNFRCGYCMPAGCDYHFLKKDERLSREEMLRLSRIFVGLGVDKIRLTGGEPLLHPEAIDIIADVSAIDGLDDLALTTNGSRLKTMAKSLAQAGLNRITVSVDSLRPDRFATMSGVGADVQQTLDGIDAALDAGLSPIKINCVVQKNVNDDEVVEIADYFTVRGCAVRFIEYMDVGNQNQWQRNDVIDADRILSKLKVLGDIKPAKQVKFGEVASRFTLGNREAEVGVISSISQPFCHSCVRARVSAKGEMFTCLFAKSGLDLRVLLRGGANDDAICEMIEHTWRQRRDQYSVERTQLSDAQRRKQKVEMIHIGG